MSCDLGRTRRERRFPGPVRAGGVRRASVRPTVQAAIDGVQTYSQSPPSGEATLQQPSTPASTSPPQVLSPAVLPHGAQRISGLTTAMQDSISADRDYQNWVANVASSGTCGSNPARDSNCAAGQNVSIQATAAKDTFLIIWNPVAPGHRQKTCWGRGF